MESLVQPRDIYAALITLGVAILIGWLDAANAWSGPSYWLPPVGFLIALFSGVAFLVLLLAGVLFAGYDAIRARLMEDVPDYEIIPFFSKPVLYSFRALVALTGISSVVWLVVLWIDVKVLEEAVFFGPILGTAGLVLLVVLRLVWVPVAQLLRVKVGLT